MEKKEQRFVLKEVKEHTHNNRNGWSHNKMLSTDAIAAQQTLRTDIERVYL